MKKNTNVIEKIGSYLLQIAFIFMGVLIFTRFSRLIQLWAFGFLIKNDFIRIFIFGVYFGLIYHLNKKYFYILNIKAKILIILIIFVIGLLLYLPFTEHFGI